MKILIATHEYPPYPGGVGRYCAEVRTAAQTMGHQVDVLAPSFSAPTVDSQGVFRFPGGVFSSKHLPRLAWTFRQHLAAHRYDVVHIADWPLLLALPWVGVPERTALVMTFHGTDAIVLGRSRIARWAQAGLGLRMLRRICTNSAFTLGLCETELVLKPSLERIVTYLGVSPFWFQPPEAAELESVRNACQAKPDDKIVLTVARLDQRKGHLRALRAIAALPSPIRERTCYLAVGRTVDAAYAAHLKSEALRLGVRATFAEDFSDSMVRAAYGASDAFLLAAEPSPDRVEGFGLVFLEAAAQGLPSVSNDTHAIGEVVANGRTGMLADPNDANGLTEGLMTLLDSSRREALAAACVDHAKAFTWERCTKATYDNLVD